VKYREKPIDAFQMTKERRLDNSEWPQWLHEAWQLPVGEPGSMFCSADGCLKTETHTPLFVSDIFGKPHKISWNDWIIQDVTGGLSLCSPDWFEKVYEAADPGVPEPPDGMVAYRC